MYDFKTFTFGKGAHTTRESGMCLMEAVAYVAGEPHSDHPECASPAIAAFARGINDAIPCDDLRCELLSPFVFRLPGTRSPEHELTRAYMAADWAVRVALPIALDSCSLVKEAAAMRKLTPITDKESAYAAYAAADAARAARAAYAAGAAARAARAAYAAGAAADAAGAARAAYAAADEAADAAGAAADAAARANQRILFTSAADLLDRMIRLTEPQEQVVSCQSGVATK